MTSCLIVVRVLFERTTIFMLTIVSAMMNKDNAYAKAVMMMSKVVKSGKLPVLRKTPPKAR